MVWIGADNPSQIILYEPQGLGHPNGRDDAPGYLLAKGQADQRKEDRGKPPEKLQEECNEHDLKHKVELSPAKMEVVPLVVESC